MASSRPAHRRRAEVARPATCVIFATRARVYMGDVVIREGRSAPLSASCRSLSSARALRSSGASQVNRLHRSSRARRVYRRRSRVRWRTVRDGPILVRAGWIRRDERVRRWTALHGLRAQSRRALSRWLRCDRANVRLVITRDVHVPSAGHEQRVQRVAVRLLGAR